MHDTNRIMHVTLRFFILFISFVTFKPADGQSLKEKGHRKMKRNGKKFLVLGIAFMAAFAVWTALIQIVDVKPCGQNGTNIGFATFNSWFHKLTGVHMILYHVTDWLGLVPICICIIFGWLGFVQLIKRRSLFKVDSDLVFLGIYYVIVVFGYLIFEMIPINYRPILIEGFMEASYPSSTTLLVLSVMPTLVFQVNRRTEHAIFKRVIYILTCAFCVFMVMGRLVCGVHWSTDIVGSVMLSMGLFCVYKAVVLLCCNEKE